MTTLSNNAVLDEYKTVFFCIAKSANSSIKAAILKALGHEVTEDVPHRHPDLNIKDNEYVDQSCRGWDKFTIVRNTWDRLVSCYEQKICTDRVNTGSFKRLGFYRDMDFYTFILKVCSMPKANIHWYPQFEQISYNGNVLANFVGRFENIEEDWQKIRKRCRLPLDDLPHYNKSNREDYREYYVPLLVETVRETYGPEIGYFGFEF